jgi:hypothetical protein
MFTENLLDTGGCAGRGWNEIAANVAASELSVSFFPAGSSSEAGAPPSIPGDSRLDSGISPV